MNTYSAFFMGQIHRNSPVKIFDWDKAARLIIEHGAQRASAGLRDDWEWTGGGIFRNGSPVTDDYTYLASCWATPQISLDGGDPIDCYIMEEEAPSSWQADADGSYASLKWPQSSLDILLGARR